MNTAKDLSQAQKPQVKCFGLQPGLNNITYLFQDFNSTGYDFRGKNTKSGLSSNNIAGSCSHNFNVYLRSRSVPKRHAKAFKRISKDPLVKAMAPVPHKGKGAQVFQFEDDLPLPCIWLRTLERLSSPLYSHVINIQNQVTRKYIFKALTTTNLHPLVIYNVTEFHHAFVREIIAEAKKYERTLVIIGTPPLADYPVYKTKLAEIMHLSDLVLLPMEHIGVRILDKFVREGQLPWSERG